MDMDDVTADTDELPSHHAVGDITDAVDDKREVFVLVGLPGAGKSTAAEHITEYIEREYHENSQHFEVSDFVRTLFEDQSEADVDDNQLGAWAAQQKAEYGNDHFVREMANAIHSPVTPHVVISGVRSPAEAEAVRDVFGEESVTVVSIWTLPDERFERKYGDGPSEEHPKWETFCERNERELHEWGALQFFLEDGPQDTVLSNNMTEGVFESDIEDVVDRRMVDHADVVAENPLPDGLDAEQIAQYL